MSARNETVLDGSGSEIKLHMNDEPYDYEQMEGYIEKYYNPDYFNNSTICDILAIYIKGQKRIYTEAKTYCEHYLNVLMLPSIFITVLGSVLNLILQTTSYGNTLVSSLNAYTAFLLALINYLKLDAKSEAHRTTAYKFDKLESTVVFQSGKSLILGKTGEMEDFLDKLEKSMEEIKTTNQFLLPETIRNNYPILCNINVFSIVKKIINLEMQYKHNLKNIVNERVALQNKQEKTDIDTTRIQGLQEDETILMSKLIRMKDQYLEIDKLFETEIERNRTMRCKRCDPCGCLKT